MSTASTAIVKQAKTIEEVMMDRQSIERFKAGIGELERFLTAEKLARVALTAVLQNADLLECDPRTILAATLQLGQVGLLPDGFLGQAYLIPYDNTVKLEGGRTAKMMQATPMIGFRGFGELIARSGKANSHDAQVVYSEDVFDFAMGSDPYIRHVRKLGNRGEPVGAYCVVYMKEGPARFEIMDLDELNKIRKNARGASSPKSPWNTWTSEMYRKSPVRRLAKYVPLSPEFQRASTIDEGSEQDYSKFDEKRDEYVLESPGHREEKAPVSQPQRMQEGPIIVGERQVEEKPSGPVCGVCGGPVETLEGGKVGHVESGSYDHKAVLKEQPSTEAAATPGASPAASEGTAAASTSSEPPQKELTYEMDPTPDPYNKQSNPDGIHISAAQHGRLWAILHAAQEKAKSSGGKVITDDEFLAYVKKLGHHDARFIPKSPKDVYEKICTAAGGEALKVSNGGH